MAYMEKKRRNEGIIKQTKLTEYFTLNSTLSVEERMKYTYATICRDYCWDDDEKIWKKRINNKDKLVRIGSVAPGDKDMQVNTIWNFFASVEFTIPLLGIAFVAIECAWPMRQN